MEPTINFQLENQQNKRKCTDLTTLYLTIGLIVIMLLLIIQSFTTLNSEYLSRRCNELTTIGSDLSKTRKQIEQTCLYAILMSSLLLLLSRCFIKWIIWGTCIGSMFIISVVTIVVWMEPHLLIKNVWELTTVEVCSIKMIPTMLFILGVSCLTFYRSELRLVGYLFEEISKQSVKIKSIIFQPILTCFIAVLASYFIINILFSSENDKITYPQLLSLILYVWFIIFIIGCQNFMIAGIVTKFHQEQDKSNTKCLFWSTFSHLIHFHLGSVCYGRFITIFKPVAKIILKFCGSRKQEYDHLFLSDTLAHIIIVKDASKYSKSSKKAFNVVEKFEKIFKLSKFGTYILLFIQLMVVVCSVGVAFMIMDEATLNVRYYLGISIVMTLSTSYCFIGAFNAMIETTIFCFFLNFETSQWCSMSKSLTNILCDLIKYYDIQYDNNTQSKVQDDLFNNNLIVLPYPSDYDLTGHFATGTYCPYYVPPPTLLTVNVHPDDSCQEFQTVHHNCPNSPLKW